MTEALEQIFGRVRDTIIAPAPIVIQPLIAALLSVGAIFGVFATLFAFTTILERKILGRIQNRPGPNRVGPFGILQPVADGIKMLTKEDIVPRDADKLIHFLAPFALLVPVCLALSVLPFGRDLVLIDFEAGLLFFFAVGAATELSVFMAGWSSRNKYSLIGAMRGIAQMLSYEVPLILSVIPVVMISGTLSLPEIVAAQTHLIFGWLPAWHVFTPWGLAGFALFMVAATAESNRAPFDLPEAESEIIAGYLTEYSGFKYALFFMGEYWGMFAISGLAVTLFLGGWTAPAVFLQFIPTWIWFFAKLLTLVLFFVWLRGTLPRLRLDQLMAFAWKFILPLALVNILVAALWHYADPETTPGGPLLGWVGGGALLTVAYLALARSSFSQRARKRVYQMAEN